MSPELYYLVLTSLLTALLWIPYILDRIFVWGLIDAVGYPEQPEKQSPWAVRLQKAHTNAVENLVVFAALVLAVYVSGIHNDVTALACSAYFWARVVHAVAYTFRVPWIRTIAFTVGFVAQVVLAWQFLG